MSLIDHRTKPRDLWTYYVVDHLPTMANIYRFDTPEEAIACYQNLDPSLRSAIGSSLGGIHEMDHMHRCGNNIPVLVTAADHIRNPLWRESAEIQCAIDQMLATLHVQNQRSYALFGKNSPSVIIDLERYTGPKLDSYFSHSILLPDQPGQYHSSMTEAFVPGHGWLSHDAFFHLLQSSLPGCDGVPKDIFLDRLNIRYLYTRSGYIGEADISPMQFSLLQARTEHLLSPTVLRTDIGALLSDYYPGSMAKDSLLSDNITAGDYRKLLRDLLEDPDLPCDMRTAAEELQHRILALLPSDMRQLPLETKITQASGPRQGLQHQQQVDERQTTVR